MFIQMPLDVRIDIHKVLQKFPFLREGEVSGTHDNRLQITGEWPLTYDDLIDCLADPPGPPPPTVEDRLEMAELFLSLMLDQEVTR